MTRSTLITCVALAAASLLAITAPSVATAGDQYSGSVSQIDTASHTSMPSDWETAAYAYLDARLPHWRNVYQSDSAPYRVMAKLDDQGQAVECWAVDVYARHRQHRVLRGGDHYTVLFHDGHPVALQRDLHDAPVHVSGGSQSAAY